MPWKHGSVTLDDGSTYPAELLINENGEVWNVKLDKGNGTVEEIDAEGFAAKLGKSVDEVYPFSYKLED